MAFSSRKLRRPRSVSRDDVIDLGSVDMSDPNHSGWFRVTPDLAREAVQDYSGPNRDLPPSYWDRQIAEAMRDGKYEDYHPQGGQFDENGNLRDARNRLKAIADGDCTVIMWFHCGCSERAIATSDIGKTRTLMDRVLIEKGRRGRKIANDVFKCASRAKPSRVAAYKKIDELEAFEEFCVEHDDALTWLESSFRTNISKVTRAPVLLALMEFYERHPKEASQFIDALRDKTESLEPQAARVLKTTLLTTIGGGYAIDDRLYGNTIFCCKKALLGEKVTRMDVGSWDNNRLTKRKVKSKPKTKAEEPVPHPKDLPGQKRMSW